MVWNRPPDWYVRGGPGFALADGWRWSWTAAGRMRRPFWPQATAGRTSACIGTYLDASGICSRRGATHGDLGQGAGLGTVDRPIRGILGSETGRDVVARGQRDGGQTGPDPDPRPQSGPGCVHRSDARSGNRRG